MNSPIDQSLLDTLREKISIIKETDTKKQILFVLEAMDENVAIKKATTIPTHNPIK